MFYFFLVSCLKNQICLFACKKLVIGIGHEKSRSLNPKIDEFRNEGISIAILQCNVE